MWIYVEDGVGTAFKIDLTRSQEVGQPLRPPEASEGTPSDGEIILLVEHDAHLRGLVRELLQTLGYSVLEARDGQEALELAAGQPHLVHLLPTAR